MAAKKFGYVRVSTREQNPDRQIYILRDEEGIDERDIYVEKESGRQFERPVYRSLVDNILREGDLLVVTELKRFGRNYGEIYKEWFHITKEIGADIKVTSMPILDTTVEGAGGAAHHGCCAGCIRLCGGRGFDGAA